MLDFFSSSNRVVNTKRAVAECLENALGTDNTDCDLIIFHTTVGHDFEELLSEMRRLAPSARIMGCTGAGVVGKEGSNETMRALAIMAIRGSHEEMAVTGIDSIVDLDSYQSGVRIATDLKNQSPAVNIVLLFASSVDIFPVDQTLAGIESIFGREIPIIGGCAYDNGKFISNWQFLDDQIFERGAVAIGFADPSIEAIMRADHGFALIGEPFVVTRSDVNRVYELDGKPAWQALAREAGVDEAADPKTAEASALWGIAVELPSELQEDYGCAYTMHLGGPLKRPDGSLLIGETCEVGTRIWLARRDEEQVFNGTDRIIREILEESDGKTPLAVFIADCAVRGRFMFNRYLKEEIVVRMQSPLCGGADVPWLGFYSGGEFCKIGGRNRFHTFTSAIFALYRKSR